MAITTKQIGSVTQLVATEGYLHLKGSDTYCKAILMLPTQTIDDYEEVAEIPPKPRFDYGKRVEELIREKYSLSEELSVLRQRMEKPSEFEAYYTYAEQCKARAKNELNEPPNEEEE